MRLHYTFQLKVRISKVKYNQNINIFIDLKQMYRSNTWKNICLFSLKQLILKRFVNINNVHEFFFTNWRIIILNIYGLNHKNENWMEIHKRNEYSLHGFMFPDMTNLLRTSRIENETERSVISVMNTLTSRILKAERLFLINSN